MIAKLVLVLCVAVVQGKYKPRQVHYHCVENVEGLLEGVAHPQPLAVVPPRRHTHKLHITDGPECGVIGVSVTTCADRPTHVSINLSPPHVRVSRRDAHLPAVVQTVLYCNADPPDIDIHPDEPHHLHPDVPLEHKPVPVLADSTAPDVTEQPVPVADNSDPIIQVTPVPAPVGGEVVSDVVTNKPVARTVYKVKRTPFSQIKFINTS